MSPTELYAPNFLQVICCCFPVSRKLSMLAIIDRRFITACSTYRVNRLERNISLKKLDINNLQTDILHTSNELADVTFFHKFYYNHQCGTRVLFWAHFYTVQVQIRNKMSVKRFTDNWLRADWINESIVKFCSLVQIGLKMLQQWLQAKFKAEVM